MAPEERSVKGRMDRASVRRAAGAVRGMGSVQTQTCEWGEAGKDGIKKTASEEEVEEEEEELQQRKIR